MKEIKTLNDLRKIANENDIRRILTEYIMERTAKVDRYEAAIKAIDDGESYKKVIEILTE